MPYTVKRRISLLAANDFGPGDVISDATAAKLENPRVMGQLVDLGWVEEFDETAPFDPDLSDATPVVPDPAALATEPAGKRTTPSRRKRRS